MTDSSSIEQFVNELIGSQTMLYAFILALIGDRNEADDVLQETNVVLWRKADEFELGTNFHAWARRVAHFQVLAFLKRRSRDKHQFNADLLDRLVKQSDQTADPLSEYRKALRGCMNKLNEKQKELLTQRYSGTMSLAAIAKGLGRPVNSLYTTLHRIRAVLMDCVQRQLGEGA